jgi:hypothetical protein
MHDRLSRRSLMVGTAAGIAAGAVSVDAAAADDPVYAVTTEWQTADAELDQLVASPEYQELEKLDGKAARQRKPAPEHPLRAVYKRVSEREFDARDALVMTEPTTLAGTVALLRFLLSARDVHGRDSGLTDDRDATDQLLETLANALDKMRGAAV